MVCFTQGSLKSSGVDSDQKLLSIYPQRMLMQKIESTSISVAVWRWGGLIQGTLRGSRHS